MTTQMFESFNSIKAKSGTISLGWKTHSSPICPSPQRMQSPYPILWISLIVSKSTSTRGHEDDLVTAFTLHEIRRTRKTGKWAFSFTTASQPKVIGYLIVPRLSRRLRENDNLSQIGLDDLQASDEGVDSDLSLNAGAAFTFDNGEDGRDRACPGPDRRLPPLGNHSSCCFLNSLLLMLFSNDVTCGRTQNLPWSNHRMLSHRGESRI
jgi:hypothetical protein